MTAGVSATRIGAIPGALPSRFLAAGPLDPILMGVAAVLGALRLLLLQWTPPGFYVDEAGGAANVKSMIADGVNASGSAWPLYSDSVSGGYTTPTYLYPLVAWARVFGTGETALRCFSQVMTIVAIALLARGAAYWLDRRFGLLVAVAALALPWGWLQASLAWDPALVPFFVAAAFLAFSVLLFSAVRFHRQLALGVLPLSLLAMAYTYPPCRAGAPVLFCLFYTVLWLRRVLRPGTVLWSAVGSALPALPLLLFMTEPAARERSAALSVFAGDAGVGEGLYALLGNLAELLNPVFLIVEGDPNLRHSTGTQGMLGLAALIPLAVVLLRSGRLFAANRRPIAEWDPRLLIFVVSAVGVAAGLVSSALTNEGQPHSLRATAAWPFAAVLIAMGWSLLLSDAGRILMVAVSCFVLGTTLYVADLTGDYPERSRASFDVEVRERILRGEDVQYLEPAIRYYRD